MLTKKKRGVWASYLLRVSQLELPINKDTLGLERRE